MSQRLPSNASTKNNQKSHLQHLIAGGCAGLVESSICHPLDTVKTMMQLQGTNQTRRQRITSPTFGGRNPKKRGLSTTALSRVSLLRLPKEPSGSAVLPHHGPIQTARRIVQQDGFVALYRGLTAVYTGIIPKMAIRFLTFEQYKDWLFHFTSASTTTITFAAGLSAGLTEAILVVTPAEVCKIRMQSEAAKKYRNVFHAACTIVRQEGVGALGGMGPLVNNPVDVVKTRLQKQVVHKQKAPKYTGLIQACFVIAKEEGMVALWKGITPRLLRIMPGQAITFTTYEAVSSLIANQRMVLTMDTTTAAPSPTTA
eukprot:scaffold9435_cov137-Cylindrotheca_fusiformis.AAC.3